MQQEHRLHHYCPPYQDQVSWDLSWKNHHYLLPPPTEPSQNYAILHNLMSKYGSCLSILHKISLSTSLYLSP